jgi:anti-sigma B factor antagonist
VIQPEELRLGRVNGTLVARLSGEIDLSNAAIIRRSIAESVSNLELAVVLDLSEVGYLDSAGIAMLFDLARLLGQHQQQLILVLPEASLLHRSLRVSGLPSNVPIVERVEDATGPPAPDA